MLTNHDLAKMAAIAETMDLDGLWMFFDKPGGDFSVPTDLVGFAERRDAFLRVVLSLIEANYIQLLNWSDDVQASGTPAEQVARLRDAFPANDEGLLDGIWFFTRGCPVGCNWELPDLPAKKPLILVPYPPSA